MALEVLIADDEIAVAAYLKMIIEEVDELVRGNAGLPAVRGWG